MVEENMKRVNLRDLLRLLRHQWKILSIAFCSVVLTAGLLTILTNPVFEATGTLSIREQKDQVFNLPSSYMQHSLVRNQVAILKSRTLAADVIRYLKTSENLDSLMIAGNSSPRRKLSLRDRLIQWRDKGLRDDQNPTFKKMVDRFIKVTNVEFERESDIVTLKCRAGTEWEAALMVNTWITAYQEYSRSDTQDEVFQTKAHLDAKLKEIESKLAASEDRLRDFQKNESVVSLPEETTQLVLQMANFETLYNQTKTESDAAVRQLQHLRDQLDESKKKMVDNLTDISTPGLQELQKQMASLVAEKAAWEAQLIGAGYDSKNDKKLSQMEDRLSGITKAIIEETKKLIDKDFVSVNPLGLSENLINEILTLETTQKVLASKLESIQQVIDDYSKRMESLPDKNLELARLQRDVQVNDKIYVMLREKYEEMIIREAGQLGISRIVDRASLPSKPIKPKPVLNLFLAVFFGLLLGVGLALGRDYFEDTVRTDDDLKTMGLKIIGEVPILRKYRGNGNHRNKKNWKIIRAKQIFPYLISHQNGNASVIEAHRAIRTAIYIANHHNECRTILMTSPGPAEGKSTTAANIAIAMANKGNRTLLVDSDLRRPVLDMLFLGTQRNVGLTNVLGRKVDWRQAVSETAINGLYILSAGVHVQNSSELLSSSTMLKFIKQAKEEFRFVVFDSPPLLPITDATVLATAMDGVILVVRAERTTREGVKRSLELLENSGANIVGAVVTGLHVNDLYGYSTYYDSYMESENKENK